MNSYVLQLYKIQYNTRAWLVADIGTQESGKNSKNLLR